MRYCPRCSITELIQFRSIYYYVVLLWHIGQPKICDHICTGNILRTWSHMYWECIYWDPDGFDPWISLVHSLNLDSILGVSLVCSLIMMGTTLGISWISLVHSLILGSILGISLIHGYDPWDFFDSWVRPLGFLWFIPWSLWLRSLDFFGSFLGLDGYDPWDFFGDPWDFLDFLDLGFDPWDFFVHGYDPWDFLVLWYIFNLVTMYFRLEKFQLFIPWS